MREERDFHNLTVEPRRMHLLDVPSGRASALAKGNLDLVNFSNPSGKLVLAASRLFRTVVDEKACEVGIPFRKVRVDPLLETGKCR